MLSFSGVCFTAFGPSRQLHINIKKACRGIDGFQSAAMTLLDQVRALVTVDVDSMDPTVAIRHKPCCNMTSNQAIAYFQATQPENTTLIDEAIAYVRAQSPPDATPDEYLQDVVDVLTILLAKIVAPHLSGKVLVQTSPTAAYDSDKTIAHAKKLVSIFEAHGIPKSRVCIKIPATPESIVACHALHSQGIHTLGTCLFSVPQALAAAQAGCIYISPYFHGTAVPRYPPDVLPPDPLILELRAHFDATVPEDLAHMQRVIASIIAALKGSKTLVMPARYRLPRELAASLTNHPQYH